jgi:hypothetical protein
MGKCPSDRRSWRRFGLLGRGSRVVRRGAKDVDLGDAYPLTRIGRIKTDRRGAGVCCSLLSPPPDTDWED